MEALVTHYDADGIISASLLHKLNPKKRIYFSSHQSLLKILCHLIIKGYEDVTILDISPSQKPLYICRAFEKVTWIDHHIWGDFEIPNNVKAINRHTKSTAQLIAETMNIEDDLIEIANEIDTNDVKTLEAEFFRLLISSIKWKFKNMQTSKLRQIVKTLAFKGFSELEKNEEFVKCVEEYKMWLEKNIEKVLESLKERELKGKKIVWVESLAGIPVYEIFNRLVKSSRFNILVVCYRRVDYYNKKIFTKLEFRSTKDTEIIELARIFNGGGHAHAAGCTIDGYITFDDLLKKIETKI